MSDIKIVSMSAKHLDALANLEKECFSSPWSRNALKEELQNELARFFVAEKDGVAVGYVGMNLVCGEGYINNIAVDQKFRRNGIGKKLMQTLIKTAENENAEFVSLEVRQSNEPAIFLYKSLGFFEAGRRKDFYVKPVEDGLILTKVFH